MLELGRPRKSGSSNGALRQRTTSSSVETKVCPTLHGSQPTAPDIYSELTSLKLNFYGDTEPQQRPNQRNRSKYQTQNVRGFPRAHRHQWFAAWRALPREGQPQVLLLQETHITSGPEALELERWWRQLWGINRSDARFTFWSIGEAQRGGVGLFVRPPDQVQATRSVKFSGRIRCWRSRSVIESWSMCTHRIANETGKPSSRPLALMIDDPPDDLVLGGDWNCVLDPHRDRLTGGAQSNAANESPQLTSLLKSHQLLDGHRPPGLSKGLRHAPQDISVPGAPAIWIL